MTLRQSDIAQLVVDLIRRVEVLEEHVIGKLPGSVEPPKQAASEKPTKKPKKKVEKAPEEDEFDLDLGKIPLMSDTELVQICNRIGFTSASKALHRDDLVNLLVGEEVNVDDPLEEQRTKTFDFVSNNKKMLTSVLTCDMHCPTCPHHQVVECWSDNKDLVS
ncbi:MAG: hypothetical protein VXZ72_00870 [Chlamydiota bacterium]|nr:hypothetical protein [Chlamydiota bacterium]